MRTIVSTVRIVTVALAVSLAAAGCSGAEEPPGLNAPADDPTGEPTADGSADGSESGGESGDADGGDGEGDDVDGGDANGGDSGDDTAGDEEPTAEFTQPYIPDAPVVTLPDQIEIDAPDDVDGEAEAVLDGAGRFMASWQALLFGVSVDASGIRDTATGGQRDRLVGLASTMQDEEWVFTGESMELTALAVSVDGDAAEVELCLDLPGWVEFRGGSAEVYPALERQVVTLERAGQSWVAVNASEEDREPCAG